MKKNFVIKFLNRFTERTLMNRVFGFKLGQLIQVKLGASLWHHHNFTKVRNRDKYRFDRLDGKRGVIVADYTYLEGNDSHYGIDFGDGELVRVHPSWIT